MGGMEVKQFIKRILGGLEQKSSVLEAISAILTIISFIWSAVSFFRNNPIKTPVIVFIVCLVILLIISFYKFISSKAVSSYISMNYYGLLHDFRNGINELAVHFNNSSSPATQKSLLLTIEVKNLILKALDYLVDTVKIVSNKQDISACVKLIDYSDPDVEPSPDNSFVSTFKRDSHCSPTRLSLDETNIKSVPIRDNTAFAYFFKLEQPSLFESSIFYEGDLKEYDKKLRELGQDGYHNTTPNWENFYRGTAVVPIRIKNKRIESKYRDDDYTILGFLCIDSKDTNVFVELKK